MDLMKYLVFRLSLRFIRVFFLLKLNLFTIMFICGLDISQFFRTNPHDRRICGELIIDQDRVSEKKALRVRLPGAVTEYCYFESF